MNYPQPLTGYDLGSFNPYYFDWSSEALTLELADARYLHIYGGHVTGSLTIDGTVDAAAFKLGGTAVDFSAITGIMNGTAAASKALILDANKDITGIRNITASGTANVGTLKLLGNIDLDAQVNTSINNNIIITGGVSPPSSTNGLGLRFIGASSTGVLKAYNYVLSQYNNLSINDGVYIKSDLNVGIGNTSPSYKLDITGTMRASSTILGGTSTDNATTRMISCLDSGMANDSTKYITLGKANSAYNQAEIGYKHVGDGGTSNLLTMGFHSLAIMYLRSNSGVGVGKTNPEASVLDSSFSINTDGSYMMDSTDVITSGRQFVGSGGVNTSGAISASGRISSTAAMGFQQFNSNYSNAEARIYCGNGYVWVGNQSNTAMRMGCNDETFIYMAKNSTRKATCIGGDTNTDFPLTVSGTTEGSSTESYHYYSSSGADGSGNNTGATVVLYCNGRALIRGELDVISDRRAKTNINDLSLKTAYDFVKYARPKSFHYNGESCVSYGWIAQDIIKQGFEQLVNVHKNDSMEETIDFDDFVSPQGKEFSLLTGNIPAMLQLVLKNALLEIEDLKKCVEDQAGMIHELIEKMNALSYNAADNEVSSAEAISKR